MNLRQGFRALANNGLAIGSVLLCTNMIGAWLFMLAEHHSWRDSFYWAWITSLSIGYGDISPETWPGKMIAMCLGAFVLYVMTPLVVGKFVMAALANQHEFTHTEQEEIKGALAGITEKLTLMQHDINMMEMK